MKKVNGQFISEWSAIALGVAMLLPLVAVLASISWCLMFSLFGVDARLCQSGGMAEMFNATNTTRAVEGE